MHEGQTTPADQVGAGRQDGGPRAERDALLWQAQAQVDVGLLIEQYLTEHPPPVLAADALVYQSWAASLQAAGRVRQASLAAAGHPLARAA